MGSHCCKSKTQIEYQKYPNWCIKDVYFDSTDITLITRSWNDCTRNGFEVYYSELWRLVDGMILDNIEPKFTDEKNRKSFTIQIMDLLLNCKTPINKFVDFCKTRNVTPEFMSLFGLSIIRSIKNLCSTWDRQIEISWIKMYSNLMDELIQYLRVTIQGMPKYDTLNLKKKKALGDGLITIMSGN